MKPIFYASIVLLFVAVALEGVYEYWNSRHGPTARRVDARIRAVSAGGQVSKERLSILKTRMLAGSSSSAKLMLRLPRVHAIDLFLQQSGLTWTVARLIGTCAVMPPLVLLLGSLCAAPLIL